MTYFTFCGTGSRHKTASDSGMTHILFVNLFGVMRSEDYNVKYVPDSMMAEVPHNE